MIIQTEQEFTKFLSELSALEKVVVDTETTGLDAWGNDRLFSVGFCFPDEKTFYLPFRHKFFSNMPLLDLLEGPEREYENLPEDWLPRIWDALANVQTIIGHNIKFDLSILLQDGFVLRDDCNLVDTLNGARLYFKEAHPDMTLDSVTAEFFPETAEWKDEYKAYLKSRNIEKAYDFAEIPQTAKYCEGDCLYTWKIYLKLEEFAKATEQDRVYDIEKKTMRVLWSMEQEGLVVDMDYVQYGIQECQKAIKIIKDAAYTLVGREFNFESQKDLGQVFSSLGIKSRVKTPSGADSWNQAALEKIDHPVSNYIVKGRSINKLLSAYFLPYATFGERVHARFKSWGTVTGRLSASNPNLQQIPVNVNWDIPGYPEFDVQVRKMFIAPEDYHFVLADYSQMEMIGFADYLDDKELTAQLNEKPVDFHSLIAKLIFNIDESHDQFDVYRTMSKRISLGLIYGMGLNKLAASLDKTEEEATEIRRQYFKQFPSAPIFMDRVKSAIRSRGYVFNRFKRRYYFTEDEAYKAINYLVQGTCADLMKLALCEMYDKTTLSGLRSKVVLQVHDEAGLYVHKDEFEEVCQVIVDSMEAPYLKTQLRCELSLADVTWSDKKTLCKACFKIKDVCSCKTDTAVAPPSTAADFIDKNTGQKIERAKK